MDSIDEVSDQLCCTCNRPIIIKKKPQICIEDGCGQIHVCSICERGSPLCALHAFSLFENNCAYPWNNVSDIFIYELDESSDIILVRRLRRICMHCLISGYTTYKLNEDDLSDMGITMLASDYWKMVYYDNEKQKKIFTEIVIYDQHEHESPNINLH